MARAPTTSKPAPALDFSTYSLSELLDIRSDIESEIKSRKAQEIEALRDKVEETAQTFGISVEEIMGLPQSGKRVTRHAGGKQPARYRGPGGEEWSGRGPAPRWMKPLLAKGKTKEDFLIK
jgi:DNA-binding protein H-NS